MVGDQHQLPGRAPPHGPQHHAVVRAQPGGGELHAPVERPVALLPARHGRVRLGHVEPPRLLADQPGAQHVVPPDQGGEQLAERVGGEPVGGVEHHGLHETVDRVRGAGEPAHDGRPREGAGRDVLKVR